MAFLFAPYTNDLWHNTGIIREHNMPVKRVGGTVVYHINDTDSQFFHDRTDTMSSQLECDFLNLTFSIEVTTLLTRSK